MGFLRKATFVATGGASGVVFKANSKKERAALAAERALAAQQKAIKAEEQRQAEEQRRAQIAAGAWWLETKAFKGIGRFGATRYLGGWPGPAGAEKARNLQLDASGLQFKGVGKALVAMPWQNIAAVEIEDPTTSDREKVREALSSDDDKKPERRALLVARTLKGNEGLFLLRATPDELRAKFAPMVQLLTAAQVRARQANTVVKSAPAAVGIADEITKLAQLHDSGVLTEDEFASQKAKLLG